MVKCCNPKLRKQQDVAELSYLELLQLKMVVTRIQIYNQIINLFWTTVCFLPIVRLWYLYFHPTILIVSLAVSFLPVLIPTKYFGMLQISRNRKFYESLSIKALQSLTQDGKLVSTLADKENQHYRIIKTRVVHKSYKSQIALYERYHIICLAFFSISFVYAIKQQAFLISFLILFSNIIYNIIPILIQQYNKLRLGLV